MSFTMVSGRIVTQYEFSLLDELFSEDPFLFQTGDTAYSLGINVGPDGWTVLRTLASLEMRDLVERYAHGSGRLCWRLTADGAEPFRRGS